MTWRSWDFAEDEESRRREWRSTLPDDIRRAWDATRADGLGGKDGLVIANVVLSTESIDHAARHVELEFTQAEGLEVGLGRVGRGAEGWKRRGMTTITSEVCSGTPRPMQAILLGGLACHECEQDVLSWNEEAEGKGEDVSRRSGLLMRRVVAELEKTETGTMTRRQLEEVLCSEDVGFRSDNLLRAIRTLARMYEVGYVERRFADNSTVSVSRRVEKPLSDQQIYALLEQLG